jgi:hypothetical protein
LIALGQERFTLHLLLCHHCVLGLSTCTIHHLSALLLACLVVHGVWLAWLPAHWPWRHSSTIGAHLLLLLHQAHLVLSLRHLRLSHLRHAVSLCAHLTLHGLHLLHILTCAVLRVVAAHLVLLRRHGIRL